MTSLAERARANRPGLIPVTFRALTPLVLSIAAAVLLHLYGASAAEALGLSGSFAVKVLVDVGIAITLAVSLTIVNGFTGQFSIGHAGFMAIGGYTAGCLVYYASMSIWPEEAAAACPYKGGILSGLQADNTAPWFTLGDALFLVSIIVGGLVSALLGLLVGLPSLRLRGDYLAIVTLGFGEILCVLIQQGGPVLYSPEEMQGVPIYKLPYHTGAALGFTGLPYYTSLFWVYLAVACTLLTAFRIKESSHGRAFLSIREDEIAAEAMGVQTTRYKVLAFVLSAFFAGVAGALYGHTLGVQLTPSELGFQKSFDIIIMVVLGGLGSISGATIAAILLTILPELLRNPPSLWLWGWIVVAVTAAVLALTLPRGRKLRPVLFVLIAAGVWEGLRAFAIWRGINLAEYRMILYALMLILIMISRPKGLLGARELWEPVFWKSVFSSAASNTRGRAKP